MSEARRKEIDASLLKHGRLHSNAFNYCEHISPWISGNLPQVSERPTCHFIRSLFALFFLVAFLAFLLAAQRARYESG